jgi:hypothetical protein
MGGDEFFKRRRRVLRNRRFHARSATATQSNSLQTPGSPGLDHPYAEYFGWSTALEET